MTSFISFTCSVVNLFACPSPHLHVFTPSTELSQNGRLLQQRQQIEGKVWSDVWSDGQFVVSASWHGCSPPVVTESSGRIEHVSYIKD